MKRTTTIGIIAATLAAGTVAGAGVSAQAATPPRCGNTSLTYGLSQTDGFAGHSAFVLQFRNRGVPAARCTATRAWTRRLPTERRWRTPGGPCSARRAVAGTACSW